MFSDVRESLPQTLANLAIVLDMLKRYHNGVEQVLVFLPQFGAFAQTVLSSDTIVLDIGALGSTSRRRV